MPSRRQIREAAVQFLYCADLEGGAPAADYRTTFWELLTESDRRRLLASTMRALEHITQGRPDRLLELSDRSPQALARLGASTDFAILKRELQLVLRYESEWTMQYDICRKIPVHDADQETGKGLPPPCGRHRRFGGTEQAGEGFFGRPDLLHCRPDRLL